MDCLLTTSGDGSFSKGENLSELNIDFVIEFEICVCVCVGWWEES